MSRRKNHNPEKRVWRGRSYRKGGERVAELRAAQIEDEGENPDSADPLADLFALPWWNLVNQFTGFNALYSIQSYLEVDVATVAFFETKQKGFGAYYWPKSAFPKEP